MMRWKVLAALAIVVCAASGVAAQGEIENMMSEQVQDLTNTCKVLKTQAQEAIDNDEFETAISLGKQLKEAQAQLEAQKLKEAQANSGPDPAKLAALEKKIKDAVAAEEYGEAARLKKELKALKASATTTSSGPDPAKVAALEKKIKDAVAAEEYGEAARLKKELKTLKGGAVPSAIVPSAIVHSPSLHFRYAGCFSHASQKLIKDWNNNQKRGLTVDGCRQQAIAGGATFFVLENPSGARDDNKATCGWNSKPGKSYSDDGQLPALRCDPDDQGMLIGGQSAFSAYDALLAPSARKIGIDTEEEGAENQIDVRTGDTIELQNLKKNVELNGMFGVVHEVVDDIDEDARAHVGLFNGENVSVALKNIIVLADSELTNSYKGLADMA